MPPCPGHDCLVLQCESRLLENWVGEMESGVKVREREHLYANNLNEFSFSTLTKTFDTHRFNSPL